MGAAFLGGKVDYVRTIDPVAAQKVRGLLGMSFVDFYQSVIYGVWVNNTKKPLPGSARAARHAPGAG